MTARLSPQREASIVARWEHVPTDEQPRFTVTDSSRPGTLLNAVGHAPEDVKALAAELAAVRAERDEALERVAELTRRDVTYPLAVIAKHGDMSETVRQEIRHLLAEAEATS